MSRHRASDHCSLLQGHLWIIDVSQSVELDHPRALDFLREDCLHVSVGFLLDFSV
jgi:serine/threonine-protein kinase RIO1